MLIETSETDQILQSTKNHSLNSCGDHQQKSMPPKITKILHRSKTIVYEAVDPVTNRSRALKLFPYKDQKINQLFSNEKRFKNLIHPNVIQIHDSVDYYKERDSIYSYLLMDLAVCDFDAMITSKTFKQNEKLARTYFHQLVDGIEYLHTQGVYHLDLKPENLLLGEDLFLKITDFDHSFIIGDTYISSIGTINYRAPELFNRSCVNLPAADIYSAAIILFVWVVGYLPYLEDKLFNKMNLAYVLLEMPDKFWGFYEGILKNSVSTISKEFQELFLGMTNKDVNKRMTIEQIRQSNWFRGPVYTAEEIKLNEYFSKCL